MSVEKKLIGEKDFEFVNQFEEKCNCNVNIKIELTSYDNNDWYYHFKFTYPNPNSIRCNPFYMVPLFFEDGEDKQEIIVKNSLSEKLIEYVLMDYEELSKYSGYSTPEHYKGIVMKQIMLVWELF
jgi:hypothetical protein